MGDFEGIENDPKDAIVRILIGRFRLAENSVLYAPSYDNTKVFIEWNFLDFNHDVCETENSMSLPRSSTDICNFDAKRSIF